MANPLVPSISSNRISVSGLLADPTRLNGLIARLAADQLIVDAFFKPAAAPVTGGALLYDVLLKGGNFVTRDVESRSPGAEYILTTGDLTRDLATPQDWGAKIEVLDEERARYDISVLSNRFIQLANGIARKVDQLAFAAVEAAHTAYSIDSVTGHNWDTLVTVGPLNSITESSKRPTADIAQAVLKIREDDLGMIKPPDTLVCHPAQHAALQIGYGPDLGDALAAVGITSVRTSMQATAGTAYVATSGAAGVLGFEPAALDASGPGAVAAGSGGLATEVIPVRERRATLVQSYVLPCFAIPVPGAVRKITGLAG